MSLLKANGVQFGQSGTATNNFTLSVPSSPDGTIKLARGNSGATTQDILSVNSSGAVTINNLNNQSFRNRIINGDMRIDQRNGGASQSITAGSAPYSVDRFIVRSAGGTITGQRVAGTGSTQYVYQITGGASVTQVQFEQRIEASNSYDLAGGNATLSVNLSNSLLATANWVLYYPTATDNFTSSTVISSGSWTISSTIARYNATISIPAAATTGLYLIIYVTAQTSGTFKIGDVQLEAGSTATEFERRPYGTELALCQRYYETTYNTGVAVGSVNNLGNWQSVCLNTTDYYDFGKTFFKVTKRANPIVTPYSVGTGASGKARQQSASDITCTAAAVGMNGCRFSTSGATPGQYHELHFVADSEL